MYIFSYMYDIYLYMLGVCVHVLRLHVYAGDVCVCVRIHAHVYGLHV